MEKPMPFVDDKKPWGGYKRFTLNEPSTVKILWLNKGNRFSLQTHSNRDEFWIIIKGSPTVTIGDNQIKAQPMDELWIPRGTQHRMHADENDVEFLEIAFGDFDEDDIVRLEDDFGRT